MKKSKTLLTVAMATVLAVTGLAFAACSGSGDSATTSTAPSTSASTGTNTSTSASTGTNTSTSTSTGTNTSTSASTGTNTSTSTSTGGNTGTGDPTASAAPITNSKITDTHAGTTEKDVAWTKYSLPFRAAPGDSSALASYVVASNKPSNPTDEGHLDADGYNGLGGYRSASGATLTLTFNVASACEAGIYLQICQRTAADDKLGTLFSVAVNGVDIDVNNVTLKQGELGNAASNLYSFIGYVQLKAGANTIVLTRNSTTPSGGAYNLYGARITTQSTPVTVS